MAASLKFIFRTAKLCIFLIGLSVVFCILFIFLSGHFKKTKIISLKSLGDSHAEYVRFQGLEELSASSKSGPLNILYLHGIGWTEASDQDNENKFGDKFGESFIKSTAKFYGLADGFDQKPEERCLKTKAKENLGTDLTVRTVSIVKLGCIKTYSLKSGNIDLSVHVAVWDDRFWDQSQFPFLGYDDKINTKDDFLGHFQWRDGIYENRYLVNAELKNGLVNYGLSDAAQYMGPRGKLIRSFVLESYCLINTDFERKVTHDQDFVLGSCDLSKTSSNEPIAIISESMGSRVGYDVAKQLLDENKLLSGNTLNLYMMANQIPLFALAEPERRKVKPSFYRKPLKTAKIVAFSEINDPLNYELVPYVESIWSASKDHRVNAIRKIQTPTNRRRAAQEFGFEVVDVRLDFSRPGRILANPERSHVYYPNDSVTIGLIHCGVNPAFESYSDECRSFNARRAKEPVVSKSLNAAQYHDTKIFLDKLCRKYGIGEFVNSYCSNDNVKEAALCYHFDPTEIENAPAVLKSLKTQFYKEFIQNSQAVQLELETRTKIGDKYLLIGNIKEGDVVSGRFSSLYDFRDNCWRHIDYVFDESSIVERTIVEWADLHAENARD